MLTPQDITSKEFSKAVFGGYDMSAVDDFIEAVSEDYATLFKENGILKSKIKVLVEKVEEYRTTEDAMRMALLTAQKMGDDLVAEAREKSEKIIDEAKSESSVKLEDIQHQLAEEEHRLAAAKAKTGEYVSAIRALLAEGGDFLDKLDSISLPEEPAPEPPAVTSEEHIMDTARTINDAVARIVEAETAGDKVKEAEEKAEEAVEKAAEDIAAAADVLEKAEAEVTEDIKPDEPEYDDDSEPTKIFNWQEDTSPRPKFNFNDLKFGENYRKD